MAFLDHARPGCQLANSLILKRPRRYLDAPHQRAMSVPPSFQKHAIYLTGIIWMTAGR